MLTMKLDNFKIFIDLVETKSFLATAKLNGVTKAAVSQKLRVIERHFQTMLIDRSQKRFHVTNEGMRVYEGAKEVLRQYKKALRDVLEMREIVGGTISISTIPSLGLHVLPFYLEKFELDYPTVEVQVMYHRTNLVYEDILNNSVDFGLVAFPQKMPQIESIPFLNDRLVLITHPSHPLTNRANVSITSLSGHNFIGLDPGGPVHTVIEQILDKYKIVSTMKFDNIETVKKAVEINAGVAIVPQLTVLQEVKQGAIVAMQLKGKEFIRPLAILHRKGRVLMPAMKKFIETLHLDLPIKEKT